MRFEDLPLTPKLLQAIEEEGFLTPTPIQEKVIPPILEGKDIVGQANTGTGKTAAFGLPTLTLLEQDPDKQMLILTPVRELALQVKDELTKYSRGSKIATIYGGASYKQQIKQVREGVQIVVATPGRLLDLFSSNRIPKFQPSIVVLDEADEMLNMGFLDDIKEILSYLEGVEQKLLFSATMPKPIKQLAKTFLRDPTFVHVKEAKQTNEDIDQYYCILRQKEKQDALVRLLDTQDIVKSIVFCRTKKEVDHLSQALEERKHSAFALHGDMQQSHRQKIMHSFRKSKEATLIATEVAGRGLNVENVTHVFNYDLPHDSENYIHRIGRTGRAGNKGVSITFVTSGEKRGFERICKMVGSHLEHLPIPTLSQAKASKSLRLLSTLKKLPLHKEVPEMISILQGEFPRGELAEKLLSLLLEQEIMSGPDKIGLCLGEWNKKPKKSEKKPRRNFAKKGSFKKYSKRR